eukprot:1090821-Pelagomonas_calceolata.AAC.2
MESQRRSARANTAGPAFGQQNTTQCLEWKARGDQHKPTQQEQCNLDSKMQHSTLYGTPEAISTSQHSRSSAIWTAKCSTAH